MTGNPKSFLFTTWDGGGNVPPLLTAVRRLVAAGHEVRVISDHCNAQEIAAAGARPISWTTAPNRIGRTRDDDPVQDWAAADPAEGIMRVIQGVLTGPALSYARDTQRELASGPADLVVSNDMLLGVCAGCEDLGQRFAVLTSNISLYPMAGVPPMGPGLPRATNAAEQAQQDVIAAQIGALLDTGLPDLNAARAALGLPGLAHVADQLNGAAAVLLGTSAAFDFAPASMPPRWRYIGPLLDLPDWATRDRPALPCHDRPLVAVCLSSTFQNQTGVLQNLLDTLADMAVEAVVTLGPSLSATDLRAPSNANLMAAADHDALMSKAHLVITHGGHGSVTRALIHGRPMLILPMGRDQADNAIRVTQRGAGLTLSPGASLADIRTAIDRLLQEPSFTARARELGAVVALDMQSSPLVATFEMLATDS